jgi:hypothetical protein
MFGNNWESAEATILSALKPRATSNSPMPVADKFAVEVRPSAAPAFRTTVNAPFIATDFWPPDVGDVVLVEVDVAREKAKFDKSDPRISYKEHERVTRLRNQEAFDASLSESIPVPGGAAMPAPPGSVDLSAILASVRDAQTKAGGDRDAMAAMLREQLGAEVVAVDGGAVAAAAPEDPVALLTKLGELRDRGVLTAEEFDEQKRRILRRLGS